MLQMAEFVDNYVAQFFRRSEQQRRIQAQGAARGATAPPGALQPDLDPFGAEPRDFGLFFDCLLQMRRGFAPKPALQHRPAMHRLLFGGIDRQYPPDDAGAVQVDPRVVHGQALADGRQFDAVWQAFLVGSQFAKRAAGFLNPGCIFVDEGLYFAWPGAGVYHDLNAAMRKNLYFGIADAGVGADSPGQGFDQRVAVGLVEQAVLPCR